MCLVNYQNENTTEKQSFAIWKSNGKQDFGVIAQQIEELYPDLVIENLEGYKVVKYNPLIALLLKSIQELHKEVQELKNKIES
jgi:prephenate dehydrogenase